MVTNLYTWDLVYMYLLVTQDLFNEFGIAYPQLLMMNYAQTSL